MGKQIYVQFMWENYLDLLIVFLSVEEDKVIICSRNGKMIQMNLEQGLDMVKKDEESSWCEKIGIVFQNEISSHQKEIIREFYPEAKIVDVTKYFSCQ